jgi:hypothetical protein
MDSLNVLNFSLILEASVSCEVNITSNNADTASSIAKIVYQISGCHFKMSEAKTGVNSEANSS